MTDIVERLRGSANALQEHIDRLWRPDIDNIREAADEIERLRSERSLTDITRELILLNRILDRIGVALGAGSIKTP